MELSRLQRRGLLAAARAIGAATAANAANFGNPDRPPQGAVNTRGNPQSMTDPGPNSPALAGQFRSFQDPPATDVNGMPQFWASFNIMHKRIQNGGWARQVTQGDFAVSDTISGVNMRLAAGGIREMHWHQQAEWAIMLAGKCRITTLDEEGARASMWSTAVSKSFKPAGDLAVGATQSTHEDNEEI